MKKEEVTEGHKFAPEVVLARTLTSYRPYTLEWRYEFNHIFTTAVQNLNVEKD
jgi:hypothetical protein